MSHFLTSNFADNQKIKFNNREIELDTLQYCFSDSDLTADEILEIAEDTVVDANIDLLTDGLMKYDKKWNYEDSREAVNNYVKSLFNENSIYSVDFEKYSKQLCAELIKFGDVDHYIVWNRSLRTLKKLKPLNQEFYSYDINNVKTYNNRFIIENAPGKVPEFVSAKYNDDARNINGRTTFNREMLNFVRFKKRLVILMDLAADKASIPPVVGSVSKEVQDSFDITNTDPTAANGQAAFFKLLALLSQGLAGLSSGNGVIMAGMDKIEGLKTNISADLFKTFKAMADDSLASGVSGTSRTTQSGDNKGSYAADQVANQVIQDPKKEKFARIAQRKINEIIKYCVMVQFGTASEKSPYFAFDFTIKATQAEKLEWYRERAKIKAEEAPSFVYVEEGQIFIQKEADIPFSEKKKIKSPMVRF